MLLFSILWLVKYPMEVWYAMMFRNLETKTDVAACVLIWVWNIGAVLTLCYLVKMIVERAGL